MKLPILKLFSALLALTLLAGCAPSDLPEEDTAILPAQSGESPTEEQSFLPEMLSLPYDPAQSLDPVACPEGMQQVVGSLLFEGLFRLDMETGEVTELENFVMPEIPEGSFGKKLGGNVGASLARNILGTFLK